ncbi:MAG: glycosyltransferase [Candidatus Solibacter usitatus]|nr:glycosyltransferase [Candidatus Solibacter usitatus]
MPVPVLLLAQSLGHGGSERQLAVTALGMDRARYEPHVASVAGGFHEDAMRAQGIPVFRLPLNSYWNRTGWHSARLLWDYIRRHKIRLVHPFDHTLTLLAVPVAKASPGVRVLTSQRGYFDVIPPRHLRALHFMHRRADGVVVNCEAIRRDMTEHHGYPREKIHVCYNGLDSTRFFVRPRARSAELVVGCVCVLRPEKNLRVLIDAFAAVRQERSDLKLLLVGSGPEREALVERTRRLGMEGACVFQPSTPNVPDALNGMDIFVHPSRSEALPNAVMEAMACGCTVIASKVGGCPEILRHEESGFLFEPDDASGLSALLRRAIADGDLRQRLSAKAASVMAAEFTTARAVQRMQEIYESV